MSKFGERLIQALGGATVEDITKATQEGLAEGERLGHEAGFEAGHHKGFAFGFNEGLEEATAAISGDDETPHVAPDGGSMGWGYRDVTATKRDLSGISQEKAIAASYRLWNSNPLMKAMTEIMVDYVVGDGVQIVSEFPEVQDALDLFIKDPVNKLHKGGLINFVRELSMFGEQLIPVFVKSGRDLPGGGAASGLVRLGSIDPSEIRSVICAKENHKEIIAIRLKEKGSDKTGGRVYKVIQQDAHGEPLASNENFKAFGEALKEATTTNKALTDEQITAALRVPLPDSNHVQEWLIAEGAWTEMESPLPTDYDGAVFWFTVNKFSTGLRGRPDFLPQFDWLDRFDQLFFDAAEHVAILNIFGWHMTVEGGSESTPDPETNLRTQAKKWKGIKSNAVVATNEKVTVDAKNPVLHTGEIETIIRQLRNFISGAARIPEHWVSEGGYTNRATAEQMGQPTFRMLSRRQETIADMLTQMCQFQVDVLVALGKLTEEYQPKTSSGRKALGDPVAARDAFSVIMPDINLGDTRTAAIAFELVSRAVILLRLQGLMPDKTALEILHALLDLIGVDLDVEKVLEEITIESPAPPIADLGQQPGGGGASQMGWDKQMGKFPGGKEYLYPEAEED